MATYCLRKTYRFEASHQLKFHDGKCARLHGHSYIVTFEFRGSTLSELPSRRNMLVDFGVISQFCKPLIAELDHQHLNDIVDADMPTAELIAAYLFNTLDKRLKEKEFWFLAQLLYAVEVHETATSMVRYEREQSTR